MRTGFSLAFLTGGAIIANTLYGLVPEGRKVESPFRGARTRLESVACQTMDFLRDIPKTIEEDFEKENNSNYVVGTFTRGNENYSVYRDGSVENIK
jgi:hypothetical protein